MRPRAVSPDREIDGRRDTGNRASQERLRHDAPVRDRSSRKKLRPTAERHYPGDGLFDRLARAVCAADAVPRKELYESWEVARRVRRRLRGRRIVDLACGHGLLAQIAAILDRDAEEVVALDPNLPPSAERVAAALAERWPFLAQRVRRVASKLEHFELASDDLVISAHACGGLTDRILDRAIAARAAVAVLPCCSDHSHSDVGNLDGWMDADLAIDAVRAIRLRAAGYRIWTQTIPAAITPKNRLLIGKPLDT